MRLFSIFVLFVISVQPSFADDCDPECIINVVWENVYNSGGSIANLHYSYVPTVQWSTDNCTGGLFAEDVGINPSFYGGPVYLFGWAKAYYTGFEWIIFGGDRAKYFLSRSTPFHRDADVLLTLSLNGPTIPQQLKERFPKGCSQVLKNENNFGSICSLQ